MTENKGNQQVDINFATISEYEKERYIERLVDTYGESLSRLAFTYVKDFAKAEDDVQKYLQNDES